MNTEGKWMNATERIIGFAKGANLVEVVDAAIASVDECPECTGTNLNEEKTLCWDCEAMP